MRVAFSITLNGVEHFKHNNYLDKLLDIFDYIVIAEGAVEGKSGSAKWSGRVSDQFHSNGRSKDGTYSYLLDKESKNDNLFVLKEKGLWSGKDAMVNACIERLQELTGCQECWLWEIDPDEQWAKFKIEEVEKLLEKYDADCAITKFHQMMGENKIAIGPDWGGNHVPRVWRWWGQTFKTHAPAILNNWDGVEINVPHKFIHYSYYFQNDVRFKADWYFKDPSFYDRWKNIQSLSVDNITTTDLIPNIPGARSTIVNIPNPDIEFSYTMYDDVTSVEDIFTRGGEHLSCYDPKDPRFETEDYYPVLYNTIKQLLEVRDNVSILDFNAGDGSNYSMIDYTAESLNISYSYFGMDDYYFSGGEEKINLAYKVASSINKPNMVFFDKRLNLIHYTYDVIMVRSDVEPDDLRRVLGLALNVKEEKTWIIIHGNLSDDTLGILREFWTNKKYEEFMSIPTGQGACVIR